MIRPVQLSDAQALTEIYNWYVVHTVISFDEVPHPIEMMEEKIRKTGGKYPFLVLEAEGDVVGYAYVGEFRTRCAYRHTVENSIYLHPDHRGKGYGAMLLKHLLDEVRRTDIHVVIAGITVPNPPSERLHRSQGFVKAAHFHEVGRKNNQWLDVGFYELIIGRR